MELELELKEMHGGKKGASQKQIEWASQLRLMVIDAIKRHWQKVGLSEEDRDDLLLGASLAGNAHWWLDNWASAYDAFEKCISWASIDAEKRTGALYALAEKHKEQG